MKDLAPNIFRQRVIVEGMREKAILPEEIRDYLSQLSAVLKMKIVSDPIVNHSQVGWAGWIHWETSGAHFYAWDEPCVFFSVDIYTCKPFNVNDAVKFTEEYFQASTIVCKSV